MPTYQIYPSTFGCGRKPERNPATGRLVRHGGTRLRMARKGRLTVKVILTGGAGYIGTHVLLELLASEWQAGVIDNFCNSSPKALERVRDLAGSDFEAFHLDLLDEGAVADALKTFRPDAVVHLAGLKAIGESVAQPLRYYENNVLGSLKLLRAMHAAGCGRIVFSSSASIYGVPESVPLDETHRLSPVNPYGQCKQFIEQIVRDWIAAGDSASGVLLRYFNPTGAHESGRVGEDPSGVPNNLVPLISQIAAGRHESLTIFGDDYDTRDGTGERDYVHVVDLARAHVEALNHTLARTGCFVRSRVRCARPGCELGFFVAPAGRTGPMPGQAGL